jgi:hypothetical protein
MKNSNRQCPHSDLDINFHLTGFDDSNVSSMSLSAKCKICEKVMDFTRGLPYGASSKGPSRNADEKCPGGILIPMIAQGEEPNKEWGFFMTREVMEQLE